MTFHHSELAGAGRDFPSIGNWRLITALTANLLVWGAIITAIRLG